MMKKENLFRQVLMKKDNLYNFYILLAFLVITISLLIAVSIFFYMIKYRAKQKHLLKFHVRNNNLKEILY